MDSKEVEESAGHQSTMEENVEQSPSVNEVEQVQDNNQISLSRTSSITKSKEISIKTISSESSSDSSSSAVTLIQEIKPMTRRQIATVLILCFVNLLKYTDRFAIAGVLSGIQEDFGINDAQGGLLSTAFVVSYMLFSPVFGYIGDRYSRKITLTIGIAFWSISTLAGSFTQTYGQLLATRVLVGVGEAMFSTVSPTIISDVCVGDTRSKFLIVYYLTIPLGSGLGFIVGAVTANAFGSWEWGLRVTPIFGAVAVLLVIFIVQEPPRGEAEGSTLKTTKYLDDLKYLAKNKSYIFSTAGITLVTYVTGAMAWWGPKFMTLALATTRENVSYTKVSSVVGLVAGSAGLMGVAVGSLIGLKLRKRYPTADPLVCAWTTLISAPIMYWAMLVAPGPVAISIVLVFIGQWLLNTSWALNGDILLYVVIPTRRSTAEAFSILTCHALGDAGSPYITGLISDSFKKSFSESYPSYQTSSADVSSMARDGSPSFIDPETVLIDFKSLQYALLITTIAAALSGFFFFVTAWYILEDKDKAAKAVKEHNDAKQLEKMEQQADSVSISKIQSTKTNDIEQSE